MNNKLKSHLKIYVISTITILLTYIFVINVLPEQKLIKKPVHQYTDDQIKRTSFEKKLTKKQIYWLLNKPISNSIDKYGNYFKCDKKDLQKIMTAITCLETGNLKSSQIQVNNLVGMKRIKNRPSFTFKTKEFVNGEMIVCNQSFTSFYTIQDCYNHFLRLLIENKRYSKVLKTNNIESFIIELAKAGYATDPNYADKLNKILNEL